MSESEKPEYRKPLPIPTSDTEKFWNALKEEKFLIQQCKDCGAWVFFPGPICRKCFSVNLEWKEASGKGKVYAYSTVHRAPGKAFKVDAPYAVALIELDEGVKIMSNVVDIEPDDVKVDMRVEIVFDKVTNDTTLPKFKPAAA